VTAFGRVVDDVTVFPQYPLSWAITGRHFDMVEWLLSSKFNAPVNIPLALLGLVRTCWSNIAARLKTYNLSCLCVSPCNPCTYCRKHCEKIQPVHGL
jgi:hypothetical protein